MDDENRYVVAAKLPIQEVGEGVGRRILGHDGQLMMVEVRFARGAVGARHSHPHRQVTYVATGKFAVTIGETTRVLQPGDSFFVPPGVEHGVLAQEEGVLIDVFTPGRDDFLPQR
jgi:quercetin dioxygenase-like cupin family protein